MIDSVSFWLPEGMAPDLQKIRVYTEDSFRGMFKNIRVTRNTGGVYCTGSLATYFQGSNVLPLTRKALQEALGQLESETGWDLKKAELKQAEIGATLQVRKAPSQYLESWGNLSRFTKHSYQKRELETVSYSTLGQSFSGYDKRKQAEKTGQEVPAILANSELIRLELKYKKGLKKRLGRALSPWDLAERPLYETLVRHWQDFYFRIPKGRIPVLDTTGGISPKDLENALTVLGLQALGHDSYTSIISMLERRGILGKVQAGRARKAAREAIKNNKISEPEDLTKELDARVREAALYAR